MKRVNLVAIALALLVAAVLIPVIHESGAAGGPADLELERVEVRADAPPVETAEAPDRVPVPAVPESTGSVKVEVLTPDLRPVPGVRVAVHPPKADWRVGARWRESNHDGCVLLDSLPPGRYSVVTDRFRSDTEVVSVVAGQRTEVRIIADVEHVVSGLVTDQAGNAAAGAAVWVAPASNRGQDLAVLDCTDAAGRFRIECGWKVFAIGARKAGFAPSGPQLINGELQRTTEGVRLLLGGAGGEVRGLVVGEDAKPIENAIVRIGVGRVDRFTPTNNVAEPPPLEVRTDEAGSFEASGVPLGEQVVGVRAGGYAPWSRTCLVSAVQPERLKIELERAAGLQGVVRDEEGKPIDGCLVSMYGPEQLAYMWARTDASGAYRLADAPAGELEVEFKALHFLVKSQAVSCVAGERNWLETVLEKGRALRGVLLDQDNKPVGQTVVAGVNSAGVQFVQAVTRADGRFELVGCKEDQCSVLVEKRGYETRLAVCAVDTEEPVVIRIVAYGPKSAVVRGALIDEAGMGVGGAQVTLARASEIRPGTMGRGATSIGRGEFEIGPVSPGTYELVVKPPGCPRILLQNIDLEANEVRDLGELRTHQGGRLQFEPAAGSAPDAKVSLYDLEGRWVSDCGIGDVSDVLSPGEHMLRVHGQEVAESMFPATVHAGVTSKVVVAAQRGHSCEINIYRDAGGAAAAFRISVDPVNGVGRPRVRFWHEGQQRFVERRVLGKGQFVVRIERDGVVSEQNISVADDAAPQTFRIPWP